MKASTLRTLALLTALLIGAGFALVFFFAPNEADQGFIQKIFYLHVPLAIIALGGFVVGGIHAIRHLRSGDPVHDARDHVLSKFAPDEVQRLDELLDAAADAVEAWARDGTSHVSVIFGVAVLATGSIWARASWGKWWVWDEPTLVSFLIVFLLYCTYYPLRYAIEDRERQARYASVFAITAGAFVPLNFLAVRLAEPLVHPRTFSSAGGLPDSMLFAFLVCLAGMALLWVTLVWFELDAKAASANLRRIRRALEAAT